VVPTDRERLGQIIARLGREFLGRDADASRRAQISLAAFEDERAIPWYLEALKTRSYERRLAAIWSLERFASDAALRGLERGLLARRTDLDQDRDGVMAANLRSAAAQGLAHSPHPRAKALLLSRWQDRDPEIRLWALHVMGSMRTDESLRRIRALTRDPHPTVRSEAQRYLRERQGK